MIVFAALVFLASLIFSFRSWDEGEAGWAVFFLVCALINLTCFGFML